MDMGTLSLLLLLALFVFLAMGMPLGLASASLGCVILILKFGPELLFRDFGRGPLAVVGQAIYRQMTNYVLISVPLFILMASLLERSGIAKDMYSSLNVWLSRTRGGIAIVTSIMAAMSGIIGGEVVLLGLIALPQMLRLGYNQNLAIGTICASGTLGTMIPPSIVLIFYGLVTETSIKALFTASFLPGFMPASFFIIYIIVRTQISPDQAPLPEPDPSDPPSGEKTYLFTCFLTLLATAVTSLLLVRALFLTATGGNAIKEGVDPVGLGMASHLPYFTGILIVALLLLQLVFGRERVRTSWDMGKGLVAPLIVIGVVLGSIYGGITGITEAAAMGVVAVFVITLVRGEMSFDVISDSLMRTMKSTGTNIWVTVGAAALAASYTLIGGPTYVANLIVGAELSTMGVFLPIVLKLPVEEIGFVGTIEPRYVAIWFGVVFTMNMQVSFLSPPFGPAAFYLKSVAPPHITLTDIFRGFLPFIGIQLLALLVLLMWPNLVAIFL